MVGVGVCIAALGYEMYGSYALNLVLSLKTEDPTVQVCLLADEVAIKHLSDEEMKFFDQVIFVEDYKNVGYQKIKLLINRHTPFEKTIYMDVDSVWLGKKVSWLFGELMDKEFHIGMAGEFISNKKPSNNYTFWGDPKLICKYHNLNYLLQTVSGFYYFKKCKFTDELFELALNVYEDKKAPSLNWSNGKADEYCFNVALTTLGYKQSPFSVFYFDKLDGRMEPYEIYEEFWGIALGGHRVKKPIAEIYNKLVDRNCQLMGLTTRHYHRDKADVIKERIRN